MSVYDRYLQDKKKREEELAQGRATLVKPQKKEGFLSRAGRFIREKVGITEPEKPKSTKNKPPEFKSVYERYLYEKGRLEAPKEEKVKSVEQPSLFERATQFVTKAKKAIVKELEPKLISPIPEERKPEGMSDEEYNKTVLTAQQALLDTEKQLERAKRELAKIEKDTPFFKKTLVSGLEGIPLYKILSEVKPITEKDKKIREIARLQEARTIYREFLGKEKIDRGFLKALWKGIKKPKETFLPFYADVKGLSDATSTYTTLKKAQDGEKLSSRERAIVENFRAQAINQLIDRGLGHMVGEVIVGMPSYMIAFALTGGTYTFGKEATLKTVEKVAMPKVAKSLLAKSIGALGTQTIAFSPAIANKTAEYMLPRPDLTAGIEGNKVIRILEKGDSFETALRKAYLTTAIDIASERMGVVVEKPMDFIKKATIAKWAAKRGITSSTTLENLARKVGWNGIIGEVFEEEIAELGQAPVEERQYYAPLVTPEGNERLLVETLGIGAFAGIARIPDITIQQVVRRKRDGEVINIPVKGEKQVKIPETVPKVVREEIEKREKEHPVEIKTEDAEGVAKEPISSGLEPKKVPKEIRELIPKSLEPLAREAVKYKTSEKFLRALENEEIPFEIQKQFNRFKTEDFFEAAKKFIELEKIAKAGVFPKEIKAPTRISFAKAIADKQLVKTKGAWGSIHWQVKGEIDKKARLKSISINEKPETDIEILASKDTVPIEAVEIGRLKGEDDDVIVLRAGDRKVVVKKPYFDAVRRYYPEAQVKIPEGYTPVNFYQDGKLVGLVMPLKTDETVKVTKKYGKIKTDGQKAKVKPKKGGQRPGAVRGKVEPEALPGAEEEDVEKPGRAETEGRERGREVARGEQETSDLDVGERPRTQLNEEIKEKVNSLTTVSPTDKNILLGGAVITNEDKSLLKQYLPAGGREQKGAEGRGLLDEYYTPTELTKRIWEITTPYLPKFAKEQRLKILEPSVGIGNFLIDLPDTGVDIDAYEINETTARITKILFRDASVFNAPFESIFMDERGNRTPQNKLPKYDVVIGNPPYGEHRGRYLGLGEEAKISKYEDYFLKRGIDLLNDGGVLSFVVPSGFLRRGLNYAKNEIAANAELIDAYRLPNGVFETTDIGTDIVIFKKSSVDIDSDEYKERQEIISIDNYFERNPDKILGKVTQKRGRYGMEQYIDGTLEQAIERFSDRKVSEAPETEAAIEPTAYTNLRAQDQFSQTPADLEELWADNYKDFQEKIEKPKRERIKQLQNKVENIRSKRDSISVGKKKEWKEEIKKLKQEIDERESQIQHESLEFNMELAMEAIRAAQKEGVDLGDATDFEDLSESWQEFRDDFTGRIYETQFYPGNYNRSIRSILDEMIKEYKPKSDTQNREIQAAKKEQELGQGRATISKRTQDDVNSKVIITATKKDSKLSFTGGLSKEEKELWRSITVTGELTKSYIDKNNLSLNTVDSNIAIAIEDGKTKFYPNFVYYQGNIYEKLDTLEIIKIKLNPKQYKHQKRELQKILPPRQQIENITLLPISDFVREIEIPADEGDYNVNLMQRFKLYLSELPWEAYGGSSNWEIQGYLDGKIVNSGNKIRNIQIRRRRRRVGNSLFKRFLTEELSDRQQKVIEDKYNRLVNAYYRPNYKQVPLFGRINATFKGNHLDVKEIQREGAAFLSMKGAGLLGYDVGVGKTLTSIIAINEVMEKRWVKRPLIVVPNAVYKNWIEEIKDVIPGVKINSLANLGGKFKGNLSGLEIEEGTLSIMTYEGLYKLGFKPETYDEFTRDLEDVILGFTVSKRQREKQIQEVEKKIGRAIRKITGETFFEDLGFDHITIDEVHNFKNIFTSAQVEQGKGNEYRNVRGTSSMRGIKAYLMTQYILKNNNNRNVFLLSATPFTNNPLEIYSITALMGKKRLEELGLKNVNEFMSMYMELKPKRVVKADQTVQEEDVIERFHNLQQLQKLITEVIDFRTGEDAGVDRPDKIKKQVPLRATRDQLKYIAKAQDLFTDREAGGAIVAITELQNITLSPYLSRYSKAPVNSTEFVENSPKIKYAVEAVAQVRKDNPEVGQIIYMPRGVDYLPFVKEYLVKEKGLKASQVDIIQGGMSINAKDKIQKRFNDGKVKVLIGTEAIKEGVNLQDNATEIYHLHLPWNPTDLLQIEGRIWRQGNDYKTVRIHYPLIENSVDSFIFQKLETKEKRIKNLWSYKGSDIEVGELDFENMKLDLITNPVIRVRAEKEFEIAKVKHEQQLNTVELAFINRKVEDLNKAEDDLKYAKERLGELIKEEEPDLELVEFYRKQSKKAQNTIAGLKRKYEKEGIDIGSFKRTASSLDKKIKEQQKEIDTLEKKYRKKLDAAKKIKVREIARPNDYQKLIKELSEENKTFFAKKQTPTKRRILKRTAAKREREKVLKAPGGTADIGEYSDVESAEKTVERIRSIEFPELVRLARTISGNVPTLKKFRKSFGRFYEEGRGKIKLDPSIFEKPDLAAKVLAHEIGHLADFMPDETLARGNLVGRLATLRKHMRRKFRNLDDKKVRKELKSLTQLWKPFDEDANKGYTKYRYSAKELYADAISVLLNDPALLKENAPNFWDEFFEYLDRKPSVKENYFEILDLLKSGSNAVQEERLKEMYEGYEEAREKRIKALQREKKSQSWLESMMQQHVTRFDPIYKKFKTNEDIASNLGIQTSPKQRIREQLEEMQMKRNEQYLFADWVYENVVTPLKNIGLSEDDLGALLELDRAIGERFDIANPGGKIGQASADVREYFLKKLSDEQVKVINQVKERFHEKVFEKAEEAVNIGYYNKTTFDEKIKPNKHYYATFQVVHYIEENFISARIRRQVGTLSKIENPFASTFLKTLALIDAIELQKGKRMVVSELQEQFPEDIDKSKPILDSAGLPTGRFYDVKDKGRIELYENGRRVGYDVDPYIAEMFEYYTPEEAHTIVKTSKAFNKIFKPLVTTYNLSWGFYSNIIRDTKRTLRNLRAIFSAIDAKGLSTAEFVGEWLKAIGAAAKFQKGQLTALTKEMLKNKAFTTPWVSHDPYANDQDSLAPVLKRYGLFIKDAKLRKQRKGVVGVARKVLNAIEFAGGIFESTTKIAAYQITKKRIKNGRKAGFVVRNYAGTPNYVEGGTQKRVDNTIFVFSNVMIQGMRADLELATTPKTRSGFWFQMFLIDIMPKLLMLAVASGLLGKKLKELMDKATEYDKTNYIVIPLGEEKGRAVYWRIPQDEMGRFMSAVVWKVGSALNDTLVKPSHVLALGAGYLPSTTPLWNIGRGWLNYVQGRNPYDDYRGRLVVDETTWQAGGLPKITKMVKWTLNEAGLSQFVTYDDARDTSFDVVLKSVPVINRAFRVSDYGVKERAKAIAGKEQQARAKERIKNKELINEYVDRSKEITSVFELRKLERELVKEVVGDPPYKKDRKLRRTLTIKKFRIRRKYGDDPRMDSLIEARTNREKVSILQDFRKTMDEEEFKQLLKDARKLKIISKSVIKKLKKDS